MFKKRIVVEEVEKVLHSDDFSAPVYFLKLHRLRLEEKCAAAGSWVEVPRLGKETGKTKGETLITFDVAIKTHVQSHPGGTRN